MGVKDFNKIILASASPRRKELLKGLVDSFEIVVTDVAEESRFNAPHKKVMEIAFIKANAVNIKQGELIIAADTTVYLDGVYYGKPHNEANAFAMLQKLTGRTHTVYTGVCLATIGKSCLFYEKSSVTFKKLTDCEILEYIREKQPFDKAGAYGIQDERLVKSYKGSYTNIVGLPMEKLEDALAHF
ncbi:MAG: septum formation protein Maf [Clostridia bacterium]|nr:septum formation protein Maf [Clostridia bacterium]